MALQDPTTVLLAHSLMGDGEFSSLFVAQRASEVIVLKCYSRATAAEHPEARDRALRERWCMESLARLPHPFVVAFEGSYVHVDTLIIAMTHLGGGDLFTVLQQHGSLPPARVRFYMAEVVLALGHLHSFDIMHRDVKPEHVLLGLDGHIRLADFSQSKHMLGRVDATPPPPAQHSLIGTPEYFAPEVVLGERYDETCDWWSSGCLAAELLCGATPFSVRTAERVAPGPAHSCTPPHLPRSPPTVHFFARALLRPGR